MHSLNQVRVINDYAKVCVRIIVIMAMSRCVEKITNAVCKCIYEVITSVIDFYKITTVSSLIYKIIDRRLLAWLILERSLRINKHLIALVIFWAANQNIAEVLRLKQSIYNFWRSFSKKEMKEIFKLTGSLDVIVYLTETSVVSIFIVEMISRRTKFFNDC